MNFINTWGIPIAAFAVVLVALLRYTVKWVLMKEERKPFYILLGMISAVYVALCVSVAVAPNENLWIIESNALLSFVTLYLIHLAHAGEGAKEKLWLGLGLSIVLLVFACVYTAAPSPAAPAADSTQETAVTVLSAFMMAHVVGLLELCLFGKKRRVVHLERYTEEYQTKKETNHYEE